MHFMSQDAISRSTRVTARALMALALVIFFVKYYSVSIEGHLTVYGVTLTSDVNYRFALWTFASLLFLGHVSNWYGDYVSYKGWNIREKVTSKAGFGSDTALVTRLDSVLQIVQEKVANGSEKHIAIQRLEEIKTEVIKLNSYAGWYVYGWNLVAPMVCCFGSLFWYSLG